MKLYKNALKNGQPCPRKARINLKPNKVYKYGINDALYQVAITEGGKKIWICPIYRTWTDMLKRAYDQKYHKKHHTYKGVKVCTEWLTFSNFSRWYNSQYIKDDYELDKDIIKPGNKIYCPKYCRLIPVQLNKLLLDRAAARGDYLIGVNWDKPSRKYRARVGYDGKTTHIGLFNDEYEAHKAYVAKKLAIIQKSVLQYKDIDPAISMGLFYHSCNLNDYINRV